MPVSYCLPADIRSNVAGTDAGTGTCAMLDDSLISAAISRASAKVSAYAGTAWFIDANDPVITIPDLIFSVTVQIATYYATLIYRKGKDLTAMDPAYLGYLDAMSVLNDISAGKIEVSPTPPNDPVDDGSKIINTVPRIFEYSDSGTEPDGRGGIMAAGAAGSRLIDGWR
jgi:phage gp36-like protein